jgi:hypothetical protein
MKDQFDKDIEKIKISRMKPLDRFIYEYFKDIYQVEYEETTTYYSIIEKFPLLTYSKKVNQFRLTLELNKILSEKYNCIFSKRMKILDYIIKTYFYKK